jgi:hypothetical protein
MARFHLMHCIHPKMHGLNGYKEIIESVAWGLEQLGHDVSYAVNRAEPDATNVIFGAQVLSTEFLKCLPADTVVYHLEQLRDIDIQQLRDSIRYSAEHFRIWEYSHYNLDCWKRLGVETVEHVPVGYAPVLTRIPKAPREDIEILMYGHSGSKRGNAFHLLSHANLSVLFVSGMYGEARDSLISRSKIVLNVNDDRGDIFEIVRVSYLLANKKAVVSTLDPRTAIEDDIISGVKFTEMDKLVDDCVKLIDDDQARSTLGAAGFECISNPKRDIRNILRNVLG